MGFELSRFTSLLERVKTPLSLGGLALLIFYGVLSKMLSLKIWASLHESNTLVLLSRILNYTFIIALICVILGVASFLVTRLVNPRKE
jgi:p-aminobenzoyl-glutamate transporter AbgT